MSKAPAWAAVATLAVALLATLGPSAATAHDGESHDVDTSVKLIASVNVDGMADAMLGYHTDPVREPDTLQIAPNAATPAEEVKLPETWCGTTPPAPAAGAASAEDTEHAVYDARTPKFKIVYAYPSDRENRFTAFADRLQRNVSLLSRFVADQSEFLRAPRFDLGTSCGADYADIQVVRLSGTRASYLPSGFVDFRGVADAVRAAQPPGHGEWRNYVVFADHLGQPGIAGTAEMYTGASAESATTRLHDGSGRVAVTWSTAAGDGTQTTLHEMFHTIGAVQGGAPNSSGLSGGSAAGHCIDEWDVMCYNDGGSVARLGLVYRCSTYGGLLSERLDCGQNDYFSPAPPAGSYLATHWNTFRSAYLQPCEELPRACGLSGDPAAVQNLTPAAPAGWTRSDYAVELRGLRATRFEWRVNGGPVQATRTARVTGDGRHTLSTRVGDTAGAWTAWRDEPVRIDRTPPTTAVSCPEEWSATPVTCTVTADDALAYSRMRLHLDHEVLRETTDRSADVTVDAEGGRSVVSWAYDEAGNAEVASDTARFDPRTPVLTVRCSESSGAVSYLPAWCNMTASAGASGIAEMGFRTASGAVTTLPPTFGTSFQVHETGPLQVYAISGAGVRGEATYTVTSVVRPPPRPPAPAAPGPLVSFPPAVSTPVTGATTVTTPPTATPPQAPACTPPSAARSATMRPTGAARRRGVGSVRASMSRRLGTSTRATYRVRLLSGCDVVATGTVRGTAVRLTVRSNGTRRITRRGKRVTVRTYPRLRGTYVLLAPSASAAFKPTEVTVR